MAAKPRAGIYLFVQFNWPPNFTKEMAEAAKNLHLAVDKVDWIQETLAASGGLGSGPANWWVFWMADYASLDRLLHGGDDAGARHTRRSSPTWLTCPRRSANR